jgi:hypothetical protein
LEIEKHHFILIIGPHVNKYIISGPIFTKTALKFEGLKSTAHVCQVEYCRVYWLNYSSRQRTTWPKLTAGDDVTLAVEN